MPEVEKDLQSVFPFLLLRLLDNLKMTNGNVRYFVPAMGKLCVNARSAIYKGIFNVASINLSLSALPTVAI